MHLEQEPHQPSQLVVDNKGEVQFANDALGLAENFDPNPITEGGDFPKYLSPEDTAKIMRIMDQVTESEPGTAHEALSKKPIDFKYVDIARLAIRGMSIERGKSK